MMVIQQFKKNVPLATNAAEGYNSAKNYSLNFKKPSLIELLKNLREEHAIIDNNIKDIVLNGVDVKKYETETKYNNILNVLNIYDRLFDLDCLEAISDIYSWNN